jgi:hypothetical protein
MKTDTTVCIASGPSLTQEDVNYVKGKAFVIVVNDNYLRAPWADVLWGCDLAWWNLQYEKRPDKIKAFAGRKFSLRYNKDGVVKLADSKQTGLAKRWPNIATGKNGGHQAVNLAYHLGAKKIILLGYDMQYTNDKVHWFGKHPNPLKNPGRSLMIQWKRNFEGLSRALDAEGVTVINCSRQTAISKKYCKRKKLEDVL